MKPEKWKETEHAMEDLFSHGRFVGRNAAITQYDAWEKEQIKEIYKIIDDWYTVAPKYRTKKKLKELVSKVYEC